MLRSALLGFARAPCGKVFPRAETGWFSRGMSNDGDGGSHDDFRTAYKAEPGDVHRSIREDVSENRIMVYMKGTPDAPLCGFSNVVVQVLRAHGATFGSKNVLEDPELREGIKRYTEWPTIPQVFIDGEFVGGADILISMHESGDLDKILQQK